MVEVQGNPVKKFLIKQFLPIGFVIGVIWALVWPTPGDALYHLMWGSWKVFSTIHIAIIFFLFGITLETSELKVAFKSWQVLIMGFTMILVGTSLTGFIPMHMNFKPAAFGIGLAVFAACPTSLSQGVTVTIQGYGNAALALLLVVVTNLVGIILTPIFVKVLLGGIDVALDTVDLLVKLIVSILVPLVIGKGLREMSKAVREFVTTYKVPIYMLTNIQVICIVWETMSSSQHQLLSREAGEIVGACLAAVLQHMSFLVINSMVAWVASFFMRIKEAERKAFIIMSSQKSLPTAAVIISYMGGASSSHHRLAASRLLLSGMAGAMSMAPSPSLYHNMSYPMLPPASPDIEEQITENALDPGLMAIPCIVFYVLQLFIDSFIATGWASKYERAIALRQKYAKELDELAKMDPEIGTEVDSKGAKSLSKIDLSSEVMNEDDQVGLLSKQGQEKGEEEEKSGLLSKAG